MGVLPESGATAASNSARGSFGGKDGEERGAGSGYFDVVGDVEDFLESEDDFESEDFWLVSLDDFDEESFDSDFSDVPEDSEPSFESLPFPPSDRDRFTALRLSVRWKPEPLNTMPTGWSTLESLPPQPACFFSGSSENDCHSSISSPHFAHS
jgi:hypothetical protein